MGTVTVHHLHQRLRLGPQGQAQRQRVDRLLDGLWQHALESALDRLGLGPHGELCIRRLVLPAWRLDLDAPDDRLLASWAQAWAQAIALRAARPDEGLWHYASRAQALADLTLAASAGDLGRAWAWRQLGLWPAARGVADDALTAADIAGLVARALTAQALAAPAVLALLARRPAAFGRWWPAAAGALPGLAQAVLRAAGASASVWTQGLAEPGTARLAPDAAAAWARVLGESPIAHALQVGGTAAHAAPSPAQALALAVLALAQAEPAWLRAATAPLAGLLAQLAAHWRPPGLPSGGAAGAATARTARSLQSRLLRPRLSSLPAKRPNLRRSSRSQRF